MAESSIEWTEQTWNPTTGCDRISPGCDHCYALTMAARLKGMGQPKYQRDGDPRTSGPGFGLTLHPDALNVPLKRRKPTMWFVNSMSDLFHKDVPLDFIREVFEVMSATPQHTYQILTKRPKRMARLVTQVYEDWGGMAPPLPNVWLGTSIESADYNWRARHLEETPAAVRFISAEPLLGPLVGPEADPGLDLLDIDWLIVGGESGPEHRPIDAQWVRDLRDCARGAGTAFFFKQWGGDRPKSNGRELDGLKWDEMPTRALAA